MGAKLGKDGGTGLQAIMANLWPARRETRCSCVRKKFPQTARFHSQFSGCGSAPSKPRLRRRRNLFPIGEKREARRTDGHGAKAIELYIARQGQRRRRGWKLGT